MFEQIYRAKCGYSWVYGNFVRRLFEMDGQDVYTYEIISRAVYSPTYIVKPQTLGQFTGLRDKNGDRIYEGDIVKPEFGSLVIIRYIPEKVAFMYMHIGSNHWYYIDFEPRTAVIMGNIHDHPDLLEVK